MTVHRVRQRDRVILTSTLNTRMMIVTIQMVRWNGITEDADLRIKYQAAT